MEVQFPRSRRIPSRGPPAARWPAFFLSCNLSFLSAASTEERAPFKDLQPLRSQPPSHVFVLRLPSLQSTWLLQRSETVCCPSSCLYVTSHFDTQYALCCCSSRERFLNSAAFYSSTLISSSISSWCSLAVSATFHSYSVANVSLTFSILVSHHRSNCSPRTFQTAVGTALPVLLILPCCWVCSSSPAVVCALLVFCCLCSSRLLLSVLFFACCSLCSSAALFR